MRRTTDGKTCSKCGTFYPDKIVGSNFRADWSSADHLRYSCIGCDTSHYTKIKEIKLLRESEHRRNNPEYHATRHAKYRKANRLKIHASNKSRRKGVVSTITDKQWNWLLDEYEDRCFHCGVLSLSLTMDRIIPGCQGGGYTFANLVPACQPCNDSRGSKSIRDFHQYRRDRGLPVAVWNN